MFELEDETMLFLYCWTFNEMQIPATRDRSNRHPTARRHATKGRRRLKIIFKQAPFGLTREGRQ